MLLLEPPQIPRPLGSLPAHRLSQEYREQEIRSASPLRLILLIYTEAMVGCETKDAARAQRAIDELIAALNLEAGPIAASLLQLYKFCRRAIRQNQFPDALNVLRPLKQAWEETAQRPGGPSRN